VISAAERSSPKAPEGIVRGSAEGASAAMNQWAGSRGEPDPLFTNPLPALAVLIVALPVAAAIGASRAHSAEEVDAAKQTFATVASSSNLLPTLGPRIARAVREESKARWGCVASLEATDTAPCADAVAPAMLTVTASYVPVAKGQYDPEVLIAAMIEATLKSPSDAGHSMRWRYDSPPRNLFDLAANDGAALRSELDIMLERLAQAVARDMITAPEPTTMEIYSGGPHFSLDYRDPQYRQANIPTTVFPGVVRRMHPQEPVALAFEVERKATIMGWESNNFLGAWDYPCRVAKIDGVIAIPPRANAALLPGQSPIVTATPGEHVFTIACPGTGEDNWAPHEISANVEAGRTYCTDGKSFTDVTARGSCK